MKVRTGFVSNSSSSSFCVLGFIMTDEITKVFIEDAMKDLEPYEGKYLGCSSCDYEYNYEWRSETPKFCPRCGEKIINKIKYQKPQPSLRRVVEAFGLEYMCGTSHGHVAGLDIQGLELDDIIELKVKFNELKKKFPKMDADIIPVVLGGEYSHNCM